MSQEENVSAVKQQIAGIFGRAAHTYDRVGPQMFTIFGKRLVQRAGLQPGAQVLDVAVGRGAVLVPAARAVGRGGFVLGLDLSPEMVEAACTEIMRCRLTNADVRVMDAEDINYSSRSYEAVLCGLSIFFFPNYHKALTEFYRLLKACGKVAISVWDQGDERWSWFGQMSGAYVEAIPPQPGHPINRAPSYRISKPGELEAALQQVGFANLEVFVEETELVYATEEEWWQVQCSHWVRSLIEWLEAAGGPETLARFKAEAFEKMQAQRAADGFHQIVRVRCVVAQKEPEECA